MELDGAGPAGPSLAATLPPPEVRYKQRKPEKLRSGVHGVQTAGDVGLWGWEGGRWKQERESRSPSLTHTNGNE